MIGIVVVGATFAAVAFQAPPSPQQNTATEQTESKTYSALKALDDVYIDDAGYNHSALSRAIAQAAAGNETPLVGAIEPFMPSNSKFCVYLNNGESQIELHCPDKPPRAAVGVSYPIEPNWRFHYTETDLKYYDESSGTEMGVTSIPIMNAHSVHDQGLYVNATVHGAQDWSPGQALDTSRTDYNETAFTTLLQGDSNVQYPSASIFMECLRPDQPAKSEPCYASDVSNGTDRMSGYRPYAEDGPNKTIRFTVNNNVSHPLPENTSLEIRFPVGIDVRESMVSSPNGRFDEIKVSGDEPHPETVTARLTTALNKTTGGDEDEEDGDQDGEGSSLPEEAHLDVTINVTDTRYAYRQVDASLSNGAVSTSQLLLRVAQKSPGTFTGGDTRSVLVSGPKPAGSVAGTDLPQGRWGVVLPTPYGDTEVERVELGMFRDNDVVIEARMPPDFNPPRATGETLQDKTAADGWVEYHDSRVVWWPPGATSLEYEGYTFAEFQFNVTTDGTQTLASPLFQAEQPEVEYDAYDPPPHSIQVEPGIWWRENMPDASGPDNCGLENECPGWDDERNLNQDNPTANDTFTAELVHREVLLNGSTKFRVADLADLESNDKIDHKGVKDAAHATGVSATPQRVAPRDPVKIHIDAEDLAQYISEQSSILDMDLETEIYAPWGIRNRTPVATFDHQVVAGDFEAPNDLLPLYVNGDNAEDILTASTDGNVYAVSGDTGETLSGHVFGIPEGTGTKPATPNILDHATDNSGNDIIGVGTKAGSDRVYTIDGDLNERWGALKAEAQQGNSTKTLGLDISSDLNGDGVPEMVIGTEAKTTPEEKWYNQSRITLFDGVDQDNDGKGDVIPGYETDIPNDYGVILPGKAEIVGTGNVGVQGESGVWSTTGMVVGTNLQHFTKKAYADTIEASEDIKDNESVETFWGDWVIQIEQGGGGMKGFDMGGNTVFNLSEARAVDAESADAITDGNKFSGITLGGADGWLWGLNASQPIMSISGWTEVGVNEPYTDVSMANSLEGYATSPDGVLYYTRNGWTTEKPYLKDLNGSTDADNLDLFEGVTTVSTLDGGFLSDNATVSWWAGRTGQIYQSTNRLDNLDAKTSTGQLVGGVLPDDGETPEINLEDLQNFDLTTINFTDSLAITEDEAWFVGREHGGAGNGYIVHTVNGETFDVTKVSCALTDAGSCELEGIDSDGSHLWAVGDNGLVLARNVTGSASKTSIVGSPTMDQRGRLKLPITARDEVQIDNITVTWDPTTKLLYGESATLDNGTSGDRDLWNETKGCPDLTGGTYYTEEKTCSADWGYDHGNTLRIRDYVNDSQDDDNRTLTGDGVLRVGPFTSDVLLGYHGPDWYNDSLNMPMTFHVNATFTDGTADTYTVYINDTGVMEASEASDANWTYPHELSGDKSFTANLRCFGTPHSDCADHRSVNVTNTADPGQPPKFAGLVAGPSKDSSPLSEDKNGTAVYVMKEGTATWESVQTPVATTYYDGAINNHNPDEWLVSGDEGRTLVSQDGGTTWDVQPINPVLGITQPHYAVDWTHPDVAYLLGGGAEGRLRNVYGAHSLSGSEATVDIYDESAHDGTSIQKINMTQPPVVEAAGGGDTPVDIDIWDEHLNDGAGGWADLYEDAQTPPYKYNFTDSATDVRLRFTMEAPSTRRYAANVRGDMTFEAVDKNSDPLNEADVTFSFDINETSKFATEFDELEFYDGAGMLRLPTFNNPWVEMLGNTEENDWDKVRNGSVGARVADLDVANNGSTIWVATEAIYDQYADEDVPPLTSPECKDGTWDSVTCVDYTLYAIDAETGQREDWWEPLNFSKVPRAIDADGDYVTVVVGNQTDQNTIYSVEIKNPDRSNSFTFDERALVPKALAVADAFPSKTASDEDPIVAMKQIGEGDGKVYAFSGPKVTREWDAMPSVKDEFTFYYNVPSDALYGSRIVVTHVNWDVSDEFDSSLIQSARLHDEFRVTPNGGQMPLAPTYTLEVVAWIEDW